MHGVQPFYLGSILGCFRIAFKQILLIDSIKIKCHLIFKTILESYIYIYSLYFSFCRLRKATEVENIHQLNVNFIIRAWNSFILVFNVPWGIFWCPNLVYFQHSRKTFHLMVNYPSMRIGLLMTRYEGKK